MMKFVFVFVFIFISGCNLMYGKPEDRQIENSGLSDYGLCRKLTVATLAPEEIREEWAIELQKRGTDCRQYSNMLNSAAQKNQQLLETGVNMLQDSQQQAMPSTNVTCFGKGEWTSGHYKNCLYDCVGSEIVKTIGATQLCPLTIQN